ESENLGDLEDEFIVRDRRLKLYEKRRNVRLTSGLATVQMASPAAIAPELLAHAPETTSNFGNDIRLQEAFRFLLAEQQGCCLIVNERGQMIHAFGATPLILPPPNGPVSNEIIKMVSLPLQLPLSTALNQARKTQGMVHYSAITLDDDTDPSKISLQVTFQQGNRLVEDFFVVLLQPEEHSLTASTELIQAENLEQATLQHVLELEAELQRTRDSLQATIEELETTNEEQQATNEELIASNEELQSTNEELQSVNEELYTVNAEYQSKIQDLTELNNDIDNLLQTTNIGVIFLDKELCVRKFTPAATQIFALVYNDVGRPLTHLAHTLNITNLPQQLHAVLTHNRSLEQEVQRVDAEQHLLMRIYPYRLDNQQIGGLVLTFVDITAMQRAQQALAENNILLETVINSTPDPIFVKDLAGRYQLVNQAIAQLFGKPVEDLIGCTDQDIFPADFAATIMADDQRVLEAGEATTFEESMPISETARADFLTTKAPVYDAQGQSVGLIGFARNVTQLKKTQTHLEQTNQDLQQEVEQRQATLLALQDSEARFRATFDYAAVGITQVGLEGKLLQVNQRLIDIIGYPETGLLSKTFQEITHPEDLAVELAYQQQLLAGDIPSFIMAKRYIRPDQTCIWVELTVTLVRSETGEPRYFIAVVQDISLQKKLETERDQILAELAHEKELAQVTLHSIGEAVITTDASARIQYCNPIAEQLTGWSTEAAHDHLIQEVVTLLDEETREPALNPVNLVLENPQATLTVEKLILVSSNGREFAVSKSAAPIRDRHNTLLGVVTVFRDVTEARNLSRQLSWQACHDPLTGLVNRRQFEQALIQALTSVRMDDRQEHVMCYLDLDQFKIVNDTSGHLAGDELLRQVALLLKSRVRGSDCLARLGGDEFGILLQGCSLKRAEIIANNLREALQAFRFVWEQRTFSIGVSIGLVAINYRAADLSDIMSAADAACYAAKEGGRNRIYVYQADDEDVTRQRLEREWSVRISHALEHDQFCFYLQRIVATQQLPEHHATEQYEVLLRMIDNEETLIPPNAFMPAAERYNLMLQIDRWVIQRFLNHLMATQQESEPTSVSYMLNLSGSSLTNEAFLTFLRTQLQNNPRIAPQLCFEITETSAISNLAEAVNFITSIQALGCRFALDDFGSGMSSFGYLKVLPVDYIKIDGEFIQDITTDRTAQSIVESINNISHVMGLQTIAESVEDDATRDCLQKIGVDYLQGYGIETPQRLHIG
ncbi:MAG: EAL domain-containing protein, partial [Cyanobacteria bacterium P01_F01_bin.86]